MAAKQRNKKQGSNPYFTPKNQCSGKEVNQSNSTNAQAESIRQQVQEKSRQTAWRKDVPNYHCKISTKVRTARAYSALSRP